jgi:hypothetical protein
MPRVTKGERYIWLHFSTSRIQIGQKTQGASLAVPNTVHEEAGDECAHEKLRADRFCLQCRDTSLPVSSEVTRTPPGSESWIAARAWVLRLTYFRASSQRHQWRRRDSLLVEERSRWERWLVARWLKTSRRENKERWWHQARKDARPGTGSTDKRASFLWSQRGCNGHPNHLRYPVVPHRTRQWSACEVSVTWSWPRKEMAEQRHDVIRSWHWKGWGPMVWRIDRGGENNKKSLGYPPSRLGIATKRI